MKRNFPFTLGVLTLAGLLTGPAFGATTLKSDEALKALQAGNTRYVTGQATHPNQTAERRAATGTKHRAKAGDIPRPALAPDRDDAHAAFGQSLKHSSPQTNPTAIPAGFADF